MNVGGRHQQGGWGMEGGGRRRESVGQSARYQAQSRDQWNSQVPRVNFYRGVTRSESASATIHFPGPVHDDLNDRNVRSNEKWYDVHYERAAVLRTAPLPGEGAHSYAQESRTRRIFCQVPTFLDEGKGEGVLSSRTAKTCAFGRDFCALLSWAYTGPPLEFYGANCLSRAIPKPTSGDGMSRGYCNPLNIIAGSPLH